MEELKPISEIEREISAPKQDEKKSIANVNVNDIEFTLDKSKSYEKQAEDVVGAMATARAVSDEKVAKDLAEKKAEELRSKASAKAKQAETADINAETEKQEAERKLYEAVLETFGIRKHLPKWLMNSLVVIFTPIYIVLSLIIGVPCGIVKTVIDNVDNIICRYESADEKSKPKIKVTIWILLVLIILAAVGLIVLKCLGKI
ncbi:MAG: hypothetical protein ACI4MS_07700 [Candidatus Coproplasma sp.]